MAEEPTGPGRGWDSELSGEVDAEDGECSDGARGREPGMVTGAEPASDLGPAGPRSWPSCSSRSFSRDAIFTLLRCGSNAEPVNRAPHHPQPTQCCRAQEAQLRRTTVRPGLKVRPRAEGMGVAGGAWEGHPQPTLAAPSRQWEAWLFSGRTSTCRWDTPPQPSSWVLASACRCCSSECKYLSVC